MEKGRWRFWGVQNDPNKAQGEFSRVQSSFFLGNGAAGSPLHLPRLGRFYWNKEKKKSVFLPVTAEKRGGGNPFQGGCNRPEPPNIPWERNSSCDQVWGAPEKPRRSHGKAQSDFFYPIPNFYVQWEWIPCSGESTAAFKKNLEVLKKNQSSVKNEAVVASFGASQEGFYS